LVSVPAGAFADCMRVEIQDVEIEGEINDIILWLAPGVGTVQMSGVLVLQVISSTIEIEYELELIEYDL